MFKNLKIMLAAALLTIGTAAFADLPVPLPGGGVMCDPPCDVLVCAGGYCHACNDDGCTVFEDTPNNTTP